MAHMVESAIEQTFTAFEDHDYMMAEDVIKGDRTVNDLSLIHIYILCGQTDMRGYQGLYPSFIPEGCGYGGTGPLC